MKYKILFLIFLTGCSVISRDIRRKADRSLTLPMVQANPETHKGTIVIWGGTIVSSKNLADKSVVEVLQTPLSRSYWTSAKELSKGRFLIESTEYLDTFLYKSGNEIIVAGIIKGISLQKIGERDYAYPVMEPIEAHVYEPQPEIIYESPYLFQPRWPYQRYNPYYPYYPYYHDDPYYSYPYYYPNYPIR